MKVLHVFANPDSTLRAPSDFLLMQAYVTTELCVSNKTLIVCFLLMEIVMIDMHWVCKFNEE